MAYRFSLDDVAYLTSSTAVDALAAAADLLLSEQSLLADLTRLRRVAGLHAAATAETIRLRRKAENRWGPGYSAWLFTEEALQQAAPPVVAAHRAARLSGHRVHDVTCSIGGDLAAFAGPASMNGFAGTVDAHVSATNTPIGSDLDPVRIAMARHNLAAAGLSAGLLIADARTVTSRGTIRYADPARRDSTGRRITSASTIPSVAELDAADPAAPPVLRLPPGIDYEALARPGEIEIVSLDGVVREAVAWSPEFAAVDRRATVLRSGHRTQGQERYELTSDDPDDAGVSTIQDWIVDPDPAVVRAHLVRHYAARHGLGLLDPHLAYLTGHRPPPGVRAFRVLQAAPFRERTVRDWARRDAVGTLEIKQRGTAVIPDDLRARIRPSGDRRVERTLIVARIGATPWAFWCAAVAPPANGPSTTGGPAAGD